MKSTFSRVFRTIVTVLGALAVVPLLLTLAAGLLVLNAISAQRRKNHEASPTRTLKRASIVIPNWNGEDLLQDCLPSVVEAARVGEHEIIVVDNASSDGSIAYVHEHFPEIRILAQDRNLGFGAGCNAGVKAAKHDVVVLLNNDMRVETGFVEALLEPFESESVFAVSAQIHFWDANRRREETGQTVGSFWAGRLCVSHEAPSDGVRPVFWAGGGSAAFDRNKFLALGGFDPLFEPFYGEDTDLSYRAWRRGWHVLFQPTAVVHHKHRGTIGRSFSADYIAATVERNHLLFIWANVSDWRILLAHALAWPLHSTRRALAGEPVWRPLWSALSRLHFVTARIWRTASTRAVSDREAIRLANGPLYFKEKCLAPRAVAAGQPLNVLFLSPYFPYPPAHGGAVRIYNLIKRLGSQHNITLVSFIDEEDEETHVSEMLNYCEEVHVFLRRPEMWRYSPFELTPLGIREFEDERFRRKTRELLGTRDYHVLLIDYTQLAQYVEPSRHHITLLTEHDLSFLSLYRRFAAEPWGIGKAISLFALLKMLYFELQACRRFDTVLTVTDREREVLQQFLPKVSVSSAAPTGVDVEYYRVEGDTDRSPRILFVGFFRHRPNVEALLFFCRDIYPLIKKEAPLVRLTVVGKHAPSDLEELAEDESIELAGFVPDVRPYYQSHSVFVAPITMGAGVRVKILEAMAAGIPIVSTSLGAEGIDCQPGRDILIADDPKEFAAHVVRLLANQDLGNEIGKRAQRFVAEKYDWGIIAKNLEDLCREVLANKRMIVDEHTDEAEETAQPPRLVSTS